MEGDLLEKIIENDYYCVDDHAHGNIHNCNDTLWRAMIMSCMNDWKQPRSML